MENTMFTRTNTPCTCATAFSARRHIAISGIALAVSVFFVLGGIMGFLVSILLSVLPLQSLCS